MPSETETPNGASIRSLDPASLAVGSTLRLLRQRLGWTSKQLAEIVGRSTAYVSKAETGGAEVSGATLDSFANALDVPRQLLCEWIPVEPPEGTHFRAQNVPQYVRHKAIAVANLAAYILNQLSTRTNTEQFVALKLFAFDADLMAGGAQEAAALLRHHWRIHGPAHDIVDLLEQAGVFVLAMPDDVVGIDAITVRTDGPATAVILLRIDMPQDRQRHTLAHELAHLVLDQATMSRSMRENEERADLFAGEFLAPYHELQPTLRGVTPARLPDLEELRRTWGVSLSSLIRRAYLHADISESQYRYWYRVLNSRHLLRANRDWTTPVQPRATTDFLGSLHASGYSAMDVCEMTSMSLRELISLFGDAWPYTPPPPRLRLITPEQH